MELSRRDLIRSSLVVGGAAALGSSTLFGPLSEAAVAGTTATTLDATLGPGASGPGGYTKVIVRAGEPHVVRTDLGIGAGSGRASSRTGVLGFAQLSDVHVVDHQSPMRVEWMDRYEDTGQSGAPVPGLLSSAYRAHEMLSAQVADAMVRALNQVPAGPVTGQGLEFAIQTGDNSDNCQFNEVRWNIDLLDGQQVRPDSGDYTRYEGVMASDPLYYDRHYWHPEGSPLLRADDIPRSQLGFPVVKGLLDASRKPFQAAGINLPWYTAFGNHDGLVQGNFPHTLPLSEIATGRLKLISPPTGLSQASVLDLVSELAQKQDLSSLTDLLTLSPYVKSVTPDQARRSLDRKQIVEEHFHTAGTPVGHGFTEANRTSGNAYYAFDAGLVRCIVMDTVNPNGYDNGSLDSDQFAWLQAELAAATNRVVLVFSHHTSTTMDNPLVATGLDTRQRVLGADVVNLFLGNPQVVAWVNGHTHKNQIWAHPRSDGTGGFWEINTASHIDFPQQARLIELVDNHDGTMSIFTTMVDHAGPPSSAGPLSSPVTMAGLSRELAVNDWQVRTTLTGTMDARNTELLLKAPAALA